jgi:hypothetical protein
MDVTIEELLEVIEQEAGAVAQMHGSLPAERTKIGQILRARISLRMGWRPTPAEREGRNAEICREFTGNNIPELAKKYDRSERQIRNILKSCV